MGRYKSFIQLRGKVGEIVYRRMKGKNFIGLMTGPTAEQVLTAPEFINTRKNMQEFGECGIYVKEIIEQIDKRKIRIGRKFKRNRLQKKIMQFRLFDIVSELGKRTINANEQLTGLILEKKGNFDFSFIELEELSLYCGGVEIAGKMAFINKNILKYMPDTSKNWYIKASIRLILVSRKIFDDETGTYKDYRILLNHNQMLGTTEIVYVNENFDISTSIHSSILKPTEAPFLDNDDKYIIMSQYELMKKEGANYINTENYITKIEMCKNLS